MNLALTLFTVLFFAVAAEAKLGQQPSFAEQVSFLEGVGTDVLSDAELAPFAEVQRFREDRDTETELKAENPMAGCDCLPDFDQDFAMKTSQSYYVVAERNGFVGADRTSVGSWEKFRSVQTGSKCEVGLWSLANDKKYLRCPGSGNVDQAGHLQSYEKWTVTCFSDGRVGFEGHRGYMAASGETKAWPLNCDIERVGHSSFGKFEIEKQFDDIAFDETIPS